MAKLTGYRRLPGLTRRYVTPAGREISYREYRKRLAAAGKVEKLGEGGLALQRSKQRAYNQMIADMVAVRAKAIEAQIEIAGAHGQRERERQLRAELRTVKSSVIKSPTRKEASAILREVRAEGRKYLREHGRRKILSDEDYDRLARAAEILGPKALEPDWYHARKFNFLEAA